MKQQIVHFDEKRPIKVSSDASKDGIGSVLLQLHDNQWLPVAYASRSLTTAECNYAQIEKECISLLFGCVSTIDSCNQ